MVDVIRTNADAKKQQELREMREHKFEKDMIDQMSTPQGRRFVWHVLGKLSYNKPILDINAKVYGAVAKQEVALDIRKELTQNCRELFYLMETENEGAK